MQNRYSNLDLLKVISIIMVLILHYFNPNMGGALKHVPTNTLNFYIMYYLESISIIAVNCFVLISGYFMIDKNNIKPRKIINLLFITIFYGMLFFVVNALFQINAGNQWFSKDGLMDAIIPLFGSKWFVRAYVVLYAISPFINKVLTKLSDKNYKRVLLIIMICFSFIPTIIPNILYNDGGYGILSFIMLYCIGAYLKLYPDNKNNKQLYFILYLLSTTITFKLSIDMSNKFWNYNTIFNVISAVCLLQMFSKLRIESKTINYLATFTFPIYIIHSDVSMQDVIYHKLLKTQLYWESEDFILHLMLSVTLLFAACIIVEITRKYLVKNISKLIKPKSINLMVEN